MHGRVSNSTKIICFHSLGCTSIILLSWSSTGSDVPLSATEINAMASDARCNELSLPTDTCSAQQQATEVYQATTVFSLLALNQTTPLLMRVYGCKSALTLLRGGQIWLAKCQPLLCSALLTVSTFPIPLRDSGTRFLPKSSHSTRRDKPSQNLKIYYQKPSSGYTTYLIK